MRLALWQGLSPAGDEEWAFAELDRLLASAAAAGADFALTPELFLPGYNQDPMRADADWSARLGKAAARHGVGLVAGIADEEDGDLANVSLAFGPDGARLARYRKRQPFGERERRYFGAGPKGVTGFEACGLKIGLLICYDTEFPERMRAHARAGADVVLVPTANPIPYDIVSRFTIPAQAAQNGLTVAYANFCGEEGDVTYAGRSVIAGPDGEPLAMAGLHPAILIADIPKRDAKGLRPLSSQLQDLLE